MTRSGSAGRLRDLGHRESARVGGEDHARVGDVVERSEDRPLQREVLDRGLDDQIGIVGESVDGRDVAHAVQPGSHPVGGVGLVEAELGGASRQPVADPLAASLDRRLVDVVEDDLAAGLERHLADPRPHRPGADDADDGRQTVARRPGARSPIRPI